MARELKPIQPLAAVGLNRLSNEEACRAYLVGRRWPQGVKCPRCGADASELRGNPWRWQCYECAPQTSYRFSHITGTIFENTNKPLRDWFMVIHLMLVDKEMSAWAIMKYMGFGSYKTAWLMRRKIRTALTKDVKQLGGIVEVDEVSGKYRRRYKHQRIRESHRYRRQD